MVAEAIQKYYHIRPPGLEKKQVNVSVYSGLLPELCQKEGVKYLVRGLRSTSDWLYEENLAEAYKLLCPDIRIVYFRGQQLGVSSTLVCEMLRCKQDISPYVPRPVLDLLTEKNK